MREEVKLGEPLADGCGLRDAIHIAVAPVMAAEQLTPGQHVGFVDRTKAMVGTNTRQLLGIVDPFLPGPVSEGTRFYLCLYPRTITGLRHDWNHPAFAQETAVVVVAEKDMAFSEKWLRAYAANLNCLDDREKAFHSLIEGLQSGLILIHGRDVHDVEELPYVEKLKEHAENYLGTKVDWDMLTFSCTC